MTSWGVPPMENTCEAGVPPRTSARSAAGMARWPTENDVAYHWPPECRTDRDPGTVSASPSSWTNWGLGERRELWMSEALANAWRWSAVWRSLRKLCRTEK